MRNLLPLAITLLVATWTALPVAASDNSCASTPVETRNREILRAAYDRWARGGRSFFDEVLTPDMSWTIIGSGFGAGTYHGRDTFKREVTEPFAALLATPVKPTVRNIWADGDDVIVRWSGAATTRTGKPYRNEFVWIFHMRNGRADRVTAFLDLTAFQAVFRDR